MNMKIAILSGKGGTGKTTVSTNLAHFMNLDYLDCDVEEPNGHIFLKPSIKSVRDVKVPVPRIKKEACNLCGRCAEVCQFNALAKTMTGILLFKELCHSCGACLLACPQNAVSEVYRPIGTISNGCFGGQSFASGKLNIKEPMAGPIISELIGGLNNEGDILIDCAPGTSCNVVKAIENVDYALLVTEPTKFGLHDLDLAVSLVSALEVPFDVLINRSGAGDGLIESYCRDKALTVIGKIPFSRSLARMYSEGKLLHNDPEMTSVFERISENIRQSLEKIRLSECQVEGDQCRL